MKKVITYGTFDLLHQGHINLLKRAKDLGDYLVVGVTSDAYDRERGKLNVCDSLVQRIDAVRRTGLADEIIVEEFEGQKILDIQKHNIDVFAIGSDWRGKFDYLGEYCRVVYLSRTRGVSSTELRAERHGIIRLGIIGTGRIARRFVPESRLVSGIEAEGVYNPNRAAAESFAADFELSFAARDLGELFDRVDAVYIASPHETHFEYTMEALAAGKHVLCEKPFALDADQVGEAFDLATEKGLTLLHGIKTAYCPAFEHLIVMSKSGRIGRIVDVEASFTKIVPASVRELRNDGKNGSVAELAAYPLLAIARLLGTCVDKTDFYPVRNADGVDVFTRGVFDFGSSTGSFKVGLGAKTEGSLVITGTSGYIYVPAPWWKTDYFEMRFESLDETKKFFYSYDGEGLRYEIHEFVRLIHAGITESQKLTKADTLFIAQAIQSFLSGDNVR